MSFHLISRVTFCFCVSQLYLSKTRQSGLTDNLHQDLLRTVNPTARQQGKSRRLFIFSLLSSFWSDAFPSWISSASSIARRLWISVRVWKRFRPLPRLRFLLFSRFSRIRSKLSTLAYTRTHRTVSFNCSNDEILASYVYRNWRSPVPKHKRHFETLANFACTRLE